MFTLAGVSKIKISQSLTQVDGLGPIKLLSPIASLGFAATYAPDDRRASKTAAGQTTYYVYDEDGSPSPLIEEQMNGGTATVSMGWGMGADGLRARYSPTTGGPNYLFEYDPQGSLVQRQTGSNTSLPALDTAMYDAYGSKLGDKDVFTGTDEPVRDAVGFQGQFGAYTDTETGLVLMGHRYYSPGTGRFLTRDPKGYGGGINLYGFTGNNPVNGSDADGMDPGQPTLTLSGRIARWFRNRFFRTTLKPGTPTLANHNRDIDALTQGGEDDAGVNDVMRQTVNRVPQAGQAAAIEVDNAIGAVGEAVVTDLPEAPIGYTRHGINQAIGRNGGRGVKASYILDALRNPKRVINQENGTFKIIGRNANVIVNNEGKVITVTGGRRGPQMYFEPNIIRRPSGSGSAQRKANALGFSYNPRAIR